MSSNGPPYHGDLEDGGELKHLGDRDPVLVPGCGIVTEPMANLCSGTSKGTACDDHRSFGGPPTQHCFTAGSAHHYIPLLVSSKSSALTKRPEVGTYWSHRDCEYRIRLDHWHALGQ